MSDNSILNKAKYTDDTDEWYTPDYLVEEELEHYTDQFRDKIVLCNCDDPESAFTRYFLRNFNRLGLKKLICTSYSTSKIDKIINREDWMYPKNLFGERSKKNGYALIVDFVPGKKNTVSDDIAIKQVLYNGKNFKQLKGDGDFSSEECLKYMDMCDICVTNPPFSKLTVLFSALMARNKKFLLISNQNALTYKEIFPYIKTNQVWVGYRFGDMEFMVPSDTKPRNTRYWQDENGQKWRSLGNAMWLTNLDTTRRHLPLKLTETYDPQKYQKYDGTDVIHVQKVSEIPYDYNLPMGVPLTYVKYHNPAIYDIIGEANHGSDNAYDLFKPKINGKETFKRLLIQRKPIFSSDFRILDLFCGAGGFSYGLHQNEHFRTVVALDNDTHAAETFERNMPEAKVVVGDITDQEIKASIISLSKQRDVNMIIGGPPCQGYSMKGKKLGLEDPRNFLFREYLRIVEELQPEIFLIENVRSLLSTAQGWFKEEIINEIHKLGYEVEVKVLNAQDYGVPQSRERAIFICSKNHKLSHPEPTVTEFTTVRDAIEDLAYLESGEGAFEQDYITKPTSEYQIKMREGSNKLYNHKASNHAKIAIEKLKLIPPEKGKECLPKEMLGKQQFKSTWGRLKWDSVSPTVDTRFDASSNGTNNHPVLNRAITPREAARIQSFDDKFVFYGAKVHIRKQIGNAVPPLMAKAIADHIYEQTEVINEENETYESGDVVPVRNGSRQRGNTKKNK